MIDNNALTAWGTLSAVIVALGLGVFPIWKERMEKRAAARIIREQIGALLYPVMVNCMAFRSTKEQLYALKPLDREYLSELRTLCPSVVKLTAKEGEGVRQLYLVMTASYAYAANSEEKISRADMERIEQLARKVIQDTGTGTAHGTGSRSTEKSAAPQ